MQTFEVAASFELESDFHYSMEICKVISADLDYDCIVNDHSLCNIADGFTHEEINF